MPGSYKGKVDMQSYRARLAMYAWKLRMLG